MTREADTTRSDRDGGVLIAIHSLRGGGAGRMCVFLANGLSRRGIPVTVAVNMTADEKWRGQFDPTVSLIDLRRGHARRVIGPLVRLVRRVRPATVLAFNYQIAVLLPLVRRISGVPFRAVGRTVVALSAAARYKGFWQREIVMPVVRRRYRHLDAVIAQSEAMRPDLEENFGVAPERIHVINNPAVPPSVAKATHAAPEIGADDAPSRAAAAAPATEPAAGPTAAAAAAIEADPAAPVLRQEDTLLFLGRFKPQKQPMILLDVMEKIVERFARSGRSVRLVAAGEGPLLRDFLDEVKRRGLEQRVEYLGYVADVEPLFADATMTVLTSAYEGFPNVLVESIARGVPVVSFDCPTGPSEIVQTGANGFLVPLNDTATFVEAVSSILEHPPTTEQVRATAARFLPDAVLDRYEEVLHV